MLGFEEHFPATMAVASKAWFMATPRLFLNFLMSTGIKTGEVSAQ